MGGYCRVGNSKEIITRSSDLSHQISKLIRRDENSLERDLIIWSINISIG